MKVSKKGTFLSSGWGSLRQALYKLLAPKKSFRKQKSIAKNNNASSIYCDLAGARTQDPLLKREMLYQLSYQIYPVCGCKYNVFILIAKKTLKKTYFFLTIQ